MFKRLIAMLAISAVLAGSLFFYYDRSGTRTDGVYYEATGIRPDARILSVDGNAVSAEEYFFWLDSVCEYLDSYVGGGLDFSAQVTDDMTFGQFAKSDAANTVILYAVVRRMAQDNGITLMQEDLTALEAQRAQYVEYYGGEEGYALQLRILGATEELMRRVEEVPFLYNRMYQEYSVPDGKLYPGADALKAYGVENGYVTAQLLYLPTEGADEQTMTAMKATAEGLAARLADASDKQATYETLAAGLGLTTNPDGLTFCAAEADAQVYQAVAALEPGQVSGVIEGAGGYYVALRMDTNYASLTEVLFNIYLQERQDSAKVEYNDKLYRELDAGTFYASLSDVRTALMQQLLDQSR